MYGLTTLLDIRYDYDMCDKKDLNSQICIAQGLLTNSALSGRNLGDIVLNTPV